MRKIPRPAGAYTMGQPGDVVTIEWIDKQGKTLNIDYIPFGAFDALLAVAKAVDDYDGRDADLFLALDALNAAHPGWREWKS